MSENKKKCKNRQILGPCLKTKKKKPQRNMRVTVIPIVVGAPKMVKQSIEKGIGTARNSNYSIVEIDLNTQKSPGNLKGLTTTQKAHILTMV